MQAHFFVISGVDIPSELPLPPYTLPPALTPTTTMQYSGVDFSITHLH